MSILKTGIEVLKNTTQDSIKQTDLLKIVADITKYSKESVRGNLIGPSKLGSSEYIRDNWIKCVKPSRFVRKGTESKKDKAYKINYNTKNKIQSRDRIFSHITDDMAGLFLTMGADQGFCIRQLASVYQNVESISVDRDIKTLETFHQSKVYRKDATMSFLGDMAEAVEFTKDESISLLYYDSVSYACKYMDADFKAINKNANVEYIAITLLGIKRFRGAGSFPKDKNRKYKSKIDPTKEWLLDIMGNYNLVDDFYYSREPKSGSRNMRVFCLKLKDVK